MGFFRLILSPCCSFSIKFGIPQIFYPSLFWSLIIREVSESSNCLTAKALTHKIEIQVLALKQTSTSYPEQAIEAVLYVLNCKMENRKIFKIMLHNIVQYMTQYIAEYERQSYPMATAAILTL